MKRSSHWAILLLISFAFVAAASQGGNAFPSDEPVQGEHASPTEHNAQETGATPGEHTGEEGGGGSHEPSPIYRWINFAILVGGLACVLRKPLGQFFAERTDAIRKSLDAGRGALSAAEVKVHEVEQKLQGFEAEMTAFRAAALKEMEEELARLRQTTGQEAEKMMESVRVQVDVAGKQARLELRLYAAEQAVSLAEGVVARRMDDARHQRLVGQFVEKLGAEQGKS